MVSVPVVAAMTLKVAVAAVLVPKVDVRLSEGFGYEPMVEDVMSAETVQEPDAATVPPL